MTLLFKRYTPLGLWILIYLSVGWLIGAATSDSIGTWYQSLAKSALNPPPIVFPVVWGLLYVMMGAAGWMLWQKRNEPSGKAVFCLFILQTLINWAWSFIFFEWHWLGLAYLWILLLVVVVSTLIIFATPLSRPAALLLLPYLLWIAFASHLCGSVWMLN